MLPKTGFAGAFQVVVLLVAPWTASGRSSIARVMVPPNACHQFLGASALSPGEKRPSWTLRKACRHERRPTLRPELRVRVPESAQFDPDWFEARGGRPFRVTNRPADPVRQIGRSTLRLDHDDGPVAPVRGLHPGE